MGLESWLRTSTLSQNLVQRTWIILALNAGESPKAVAERLETSTPNVFKWRNHYIEQGLSGLQDAPRPGQPRKLDRKKVKSILDDTVKKLPKESTHWSVRLMAEYADVSRSQVHQIWKAVDLKPSQIERRTHDYKRYGTISLYAALNILNGEVIGRITQRHRAKEFLDFLR